MLSWAGNDSGITVDLTAIAGDGHDIELEHGSALLQFATACAGRNDDELAERRRALETATSRAFMVDAAAVAANFEMMTRLADGTGARMPSEMIEQRSATIGAMGVGRLTSKR